MTGRRILDVAAILKVSQGVAANHVALRQHQLDLYRKTSSLAEAVKSQTDRITLTVKAASILAERFNGPGFDRSTQASQAKDSQQRTTTTSEPQAPGTDNGTDKSLENDGGSPHDRFDERSDQNSALRRVKLPKNTEDGQQNDEHLLDAQMNQDVFYTSTPRSEEKSVPQAQAVPEQDQNSDESYTELFHSPRVARMLSGETRPSQPSTRLVIPGAHKTPVKQTKVPQEKDQVSFSIRPLAQEIQDGPQSRPTSTVDSKPSQAEGTEDAHELAADIAKDAKNLSVDSSQVRRLRQMSTNLVLID